MGQASVTVAVATVLILSQARAAEYFIAPAGSDANTGSINSPFASFSKAIGLANAGDRIYARGGTYSLNSTVSIPSSKSGTSLNPISLLAYPGEEPILDFRNQAYSGNNSGQKGLTLNGSYWHLKGLTIQYAADNGIAIGGSYNRIEQIVARQNQDSGFQISGSSKPSYNLILNCDSYGNYDFGAGGENADGFAIKFRELGPGNLVSGARAYNNADDGFDFWEAGNGISVVNSWSFHNGIASVFNNPSGFNGDGNGIKLGKDSGTHVLQRMMVWGNAAHGVDVNGNATEVTQPANPIAHGVQILNVTSAFNGSRNFNIDENPGLASPPTQHILRNNISYSGSTRIDAGNTADHNTFNGPGGSPVGAGASASDFTSVLNPVISNGSYRPSGTGGDRSGLTAPMHATGPALAPRSPDGSLPWIDFLRLSPASQLIDAGVDVGLPYDGLAPDMGALETKAGVIYAAADFDEDGDVDSNDLVTWKTGYGMPSGAAHADGDADKDVDVDGADFLIWQRGYQSKSALATSRSVPEPGALSLISLVVAVHTLRERSRS